MTTTYRLCWPIEEQQNETQKGLSLIELLIVVAMIDLIAAIAFPHILASRRAANAGSAQSSLGTIFGGQAAYQVTIGRGALATDLTTLGTSKYSRTVLLPAWVAKLGAVSYGLRRVWVYENHQDLAEHHQPSGPRTARLELGLACKRSSFSYMLIVLAREPQLESWRS